MNKNADCSAISGFLFVPKFFRDHWQLNRDKDSPRLKGAWRTPKSLFNSILQTNPDRLISIHNFYWEFDPGSGWTLAACLRHASRTVLRDSGRRVRKTVVTYPRVVNNSSKDGLIHDSLIKTYVFMSKAFTLWEGPLFYQLVGKVMAYQGYDG